MPYRIEYLEDNGIIFIESIGEMAYEDYKRQTEEAIALSRKFNATLYMTDLRQVLNRTKLSDVIRINELYTELGQSRETRLALLANGSQKDYGLIKIFEVSSRVRGWNVRIFSEFEDAVQWLLA